MAGREDIPTLAKRVAAAKRELEALKKVPQPMAGDSFLFYRGISEDAWDLQFSGITGTTWERLYKLTMNVEDPSRGFANIFYDYDYDYSEILSYGIDPVRDDPYSYWVRLYHPSWTAAAGKLRVKFYLFAPQRGTIELTLISSTA